MAPMDPRWAVHLDHRRQATSAEGGMPVMNAERRTECIAKGDCRVLESNLDERRCSSKALAEFGSKSDRSDLIPLSLLPGTLAIWRLEAGRDFILYKFQSRLGERIEAASFASRGSRFAVHSSLVRCVLGLTSCACCGVEHL